MHILHYFKFGSASLLGRNSKQCKFCISQPDSLDCNAFSSSSSDKMNQSFTWCPGCQMALVVSKVRQIHLKILSAFLFHVLITLLSITGNKLRKKRVIFRGKDGAAVSSSSGDEMNQSRAPRPLDGAASQQSASGSSEDPFSMWAKQMMPSENSYSTYDTHHHNEKRFTDVLR